MTEKVILTCPHCGNKTLMKLLNKYENVSIADLGYGEEATYHDIFEVFECPVCSDFHLYHTHWNTEDAYYEDYDVYEYGTVLYPQMEKVNLNGLPKIIRKAYESALNVKNIDNTVCAIALRRTLEMVCKDKGAVSGQLHQKLNQLQQKGILPPLMGDISKVIKDFGNMAAHGDQVEFDRYMVESMFRFTNKILEFVYLLPKEMKRAKNELEYLTEEAKEKDKDKEEANQEEETLMTKEQLHKEVRELILNNWEFKNNEEALEKIDAFLNELLDKSSKGEKQ